MIVEENNIFQMVFEKEIAALSKCADFLQKISLEPLCSMLNDCAGKMFFSGVGKNKYVVKKIVHTMHSLGLSAFYLDAVGALHGDIGILESGDVLCLISKSGNTSELVKLNYEAKKRGVATIAVTCGNSSQLAKECGFVQLLPEVEEADTEGVLPTASTTMFLCVGDAIAIWLSREQKSVNQFLNNHPGGELGRFRKLHAWEEQRASIRLLVMDVDGTLTDGTLRYEKEDVFVGYNVKDGYGIRKILSFYDISCAVITGRINESLAKRAEALGITSVYQGVGDKAEVLKQIAKVNQLALEQIAYIGDDLNDLECMQYCGLTGCPADAADAVKEKCNFVSQYRGGEGAVREFIDWICAGREN